MSNVVKLSSNDISMQFCRYSYQKYESLLKNKTRLKMKEFDNIDTTIAKSFPNLLWNLLYKLHSRPTTIRHNNSLVQ